jgi:hypothetical protein
MMLSCMFCWLPTGRAPKHLSAFRPVLYAASYVVRIFAFFTSQTLTAIGNNKDFMQYAPIFQGQRQPNTIMMPCKLCTLLHSVSLSKSYRECAAQSTSPSCEYHITSSERAYCLHIENAIRLLGLKATRTSPSATRRRFSMDHKPIMCSRPSPVPL